MFHSGLCLKTLCRVIEYKDGSMDLDLKTVFKARMSYMKHHLIEQIIGLF